MPVNCDRSKYAVGVNLDKSPDKEHDIPSGDSQGQAADGQRIDPTRRRFSRNAVLGSAVFMSLASRAAWAEVPVEQCLSATTWDSLSSDFASLTPANEDKLLEIQMRGIDTEHSLYPDYICPTDPNARIAPLNDQACSDKNNRTVNMMRGKGADTCADTDEPIFPDKKKRTIYELGKP